MEQTYTNKGTRYDRPDGRTGTFDWNPAFPAGNGAMPPNNLPVGVLLRRGADCVKADGTTRRGTSYEFDWVCACEVSSGAGGSGLPGGLTPGAGCCGRTIADVMTATVTVLAGTCAEIDGQTFNFEYVGGNTWIGTLEIADGSATITATCNEDGSWTGGYFASGSLFWSGGAVLIDCGPPWTGTWPASLNDSNCPGAAAQVTVTE